MLSDNDILKKYDVELSLYANSVQNSFHYYLEKECVPYQPFLKYLYDFYLFSSYLVDNDLFKNDDKYLPLRLLFAKSCMTFYSVYLLLQNGLLIEASILLRSLFEAYLSVKLIVQQDTDERLRLYGNYSKVERWNYLQSNKKLVQVGKLRQEDFERTFNAQLVKNIEAEYEDVKSDYHPQKPYQWTWKIYQPILKGNNPSNRFIAQQLNLEFDYVKIYSLTSGFVHNSPNLAKLISDGNAISLSPRFGDLIYSDGCIALDYIAKIIELNVSYFRFREPNEIKTYLDHYVLAALDEAKKHDAL
jgi:Family of unknown function (DUF5677)